MSTYPKAKDTALLATILVTRSLGMSNFFDGRTIRKWLRLAFTASPTNGTIPAVRSAPVKPTNEERVADA